MRLLRRRLSPAECLKHPWPSVIAGVRAAVDQGRKSGGLVKMHAVVNSRGRLPPGSSTGEVQ